MWGLSQNEAVLIQGFPLLAYTESAGLVQVWVVNFRSTDSISLIAAVYVGDQTHEAYSRIGLTCKFYVILLHNYIACNFRWRWLLGWEHDTPVQCHDWNEFEYHWGWNESPWLGFHWNNWIYWFVVDSVGSRQPWRLRHVSRWRQVFKISSSRLLTGSRPRTNIVHYKMYVVGLD